MKLRWSDLFVGLCWNTTEKAKNAYTRVLLLLKLNWLIYLSNSQKNLQGVYTKFLTLPQKRLLKRKKEKFLNVSIIKLKNRFQIWKRFFFICKAGLWCRKVKTSPKLPQISLYGAAEIAKNRAKTSVFCSFLPDFGAVDRNWRGFQNTESLYL